MKPSHRLTAWILTLVLLPVVTLTATLALLAGHNGTGTDSRADVIGAGAVIAAVAAVLTMILARRTSRITHLHSDTAQTRHLDAVRRDFVANVSHELRTPLTVIGGFAETLAEGPLGDEDRARFASLIVTHTRRMQRIVDDLLDLSRIESGGWVPHPSYLDVGDVANEVIAAYTDVAREHDVTLEALVAPEARRLYADRMALRQVLGNLVENAVRHTFHGSVMMATRAERDGTLWVEVRDSGSGISPAHLPRIFERFYRADSARDRESGGTGLGLAVVKHLVEAHGGQVRAESTVGEGTTISVSFPAAAPGTET